jgi:hypothetical protein
MTTRDAILLAVPTFAAHACDGPATLRCELGKVGISPALAAEIIDFLPLALARAMLDGLGIQFADHYVRRTAQGQVGGENRLADEPVYQEGLTIANEISGMGGDAFMAVAGWSTEYRAINRVMNAGSLAENIVCAPPIFLAQDYDRRKDVETANGTMSRARTWWQFWK